MERVVQRIVVSNEKRDWVYSLVDGTEIELKVPVSTSRRFDETDLGGLVFFRNGGHAEIKPINRLSEGSKAFKNADRIHIRIGEEQFYFDFEGDGIVFATEGFEELYKANIVFDDGSKMKLIGKQFDDKQLEGEDLKYKETDVSPTHIDVEEAKKIYFVNNVFCEDEYIDFEELRQQSEEALERWSEQVRQRTKEEFVPHRTKSLKNIAWAHASATISDKDIAISAARNFIDEHLRDMPYYELHEDKESVSVSFSFDKKRFE